MERNPYTAPQANVAAEPRHEPPEWRRAKWIFSWLWLLLTVLPAVNAALVPRPTPDGVVLAVNCLLALGFGGFIARDMWLLKVRHSPLWIDIATYAVVLVGFVSIVLVKEMGILVWNDLHFDIPVFLLMGTIASAAWITEAKKRVRVYVGARHFIFARDDAGV